MSIISVLLIAVNILVFIGLYVVWTRLRKPPQDDPRLSRGLQLLQSKISVLEDLSDRTERQVKQLNALMDQKCKQIQQKVEEADQKVRHIELATQKSLEVAEIFQDRIPHEEVIQRKDTVRYVQAAKLAHAGLTPEQIAETVDLPMSEIELIAKVNKDELMFDESNLPDWAKKMTEPKELTDLEEQDWSMGHHQEPLKPDFSEAFNVERPNYDSLKSLGEEFRRACHDFDEKQKKDERTIEAVLEAPSQIIDAGKNIGEKLNQFSQHVFENLAEASAKVKNKIEQKAPVHTSSIEIVEASPSEKGFLLPEIKQGEGSALNFNGTEQSSSSARTFVKKIEVKDDSVHEARKHEFPQLGLEIKPKI